MQVCAGVRSDSAKPESGKEMLYFFFFLFAVSLFCGALTSKKDFRLCFKVQVEEWISGFNSRRTVYIRICTSTAQCFSRSSSQKPFGFIRKTSRIIGHASVIKPDTYLFRLRFLMLAGLVKSHLSIDVFQSKRASYPPKA